MIYLHQLATESFCHFASVLFLRNFASAKFTKIRPRKNFRVYSITMLSFECSNEDGIDCICLVISSPYTGEKSTSFTVLFHFLLICRSSCQSHPEKRRKNNIITETFLPKNSYLPTYFLSRNKQHWSFLVSQRIKFDKNAIFWYLLFDSHYKFARSILYKWTYEKNHFSVPRFYIFQC